MIYLTLEDFVSVRAALGQRVADAKFLAKGRPNAAARGDSDDLTRPAEGIDVPPAVFHLTYEDSHGGVSQRVVTIRRIERAREVFRLHGYCHLRRMPRCFSTDRIQEAFDITTGEVVSDPRTFFSFHPLYTDPADPQQEAISLCRHEVNILTVLGASDGLFDPDEQDVVLGHVFNRCEHLDLDEAGVRQLLALIAPDQPSFAASLMQMSRFKAGCSTSLRRSMRRLVDIDGQLTREEINFVTEIEETLNAA